MDTLRTKTGYELSKLSRHEAITLFKHWHEIALNDSILWETRDTACKICGILKRHFNL